MFVWFFFPVFWGQKWQIWAPHRRSTSRGRGLGAGAEPRWPAGRWAALRADRWLWAERQRARAAVC